MPRAWRPRRFALVTDFGRGPYTGQIELLLAAHRPRCPVVDLVSDLTPFRPDLAGLLLPGLRRGMPGRTLYLCVVDPGVGGARGIVAARVGADWLLAPDNGLLVPLLRGSAPTDVCLWRVLWRPPTLSASFHGRDLFTPLAQQIARGRLPQATPVDASDLVGADWPATTATVCYVDRYGNVMTGMPARELSDATVLVIGDTRVARARTFSDVAVGTAFWYENAFGLVEIAVNQGRADVDLSLRTGDSITCRP